MRQKNGFAKYSCYMESSHNSKFIFTFLLSLEGTFRFFFCWWSKAFFNSKLNLLNQHWLWFQLIFFLFNLILLLFSGLCLFHTGSPELTKLILGLYYPSLPRWVAHCPGTSKAMCCWGQLLVLHSLWKQLREASVDGDGSLSDSRFMCLGFHPGVARTRAVEGPNNVQT